MEEINNLDLDDVLDVMLDFPVVPLGRKVIITLNREEVDGMMQLSENTFAESQYVVAVGSHIKEFVPGNRVLLDVEKMMEYIPSETNSHERVGHVKIKPVEVDGVMYGLINDNVIDAIDNR